MGVEETGSSGFKKKHQSNHRNKMSNHSPLAPLVSVCVQTYNHERYIEACLEGILMQQTTFPFEIILGEDESSDGTREICKAYAQKHPDKIKLFLRSRKDVIFINGRPTGRYNFIENLKASTGKYIALCEGDDYWTDPLKLQKQVDFLEANPEYVICGHNAKIIDDNNNVIQEKKRPGLIVDKEYSELALKKGAFLLTLSLVFKNVINEYPNSLYKVKNGDTFLISLLGNYGKGMYLENIDPAIYRVHDGGVWSKLGQNDKKLNSFNTYKQIKSYYKDKNDLITVSEIDLILRKISRALFRNMDSGTRLGIYFSTTFRYIRYSNIYSFSTAKEIVKVSIKYFHAKLIHKY